MVNAVDMGEYDFDTQVAISRSTDILLGVCLARGTFP